MIIFNLFEGYGIAAVVALCFIALASIFVWTNLKLVSQWREAQRYATLKMRVESRVDLTDNLFFVNLTHETLKILPSFYPGQYLTIDIPIRESQTIQRAYSIANWHPHPTSFQLGIKREEMGKGSTWLHQYLKQGTKIRVRYPQGEFYLPPDIQGDVVMVAAGIGITPFRAMVQAATTHYPRHGVPPNVYLFYSCRTDEQLCYHDEFTSLQSLHANFRYIPVVTGQSDTWQGQRGRVSLETIKSYVPQWREATFYLCAGTAMMEALTDHLVANRVPVSKIVTENYGAEAISEETKHYYIHYKGETVEFAKHPTLFQALEDSSVGVEGHCQAGTCGLCKCRLVEGSVKYVVKHEHKLHPNEILPCCCVPQTNLVLK